MHRPLLSNGATGLGPWLTCGELDVDHDLHVLAPAHGGRIRSRIRQKSKTTPWHVAASERRAEIPCGAHPLQPAHGARHASFSKAQCTLPSMKKSLESGRPSALPTRLPPICSTALVQLRHFPQFHCEIATFFPSRPALDSKVTSDLNGQDWAATVRRSSLSTMTVRCFSCTCALRVGPRCELQQRNLAKPWPL